MVDLSSSLTVSHNQMVPQIDPNITESSKWIRICTPYFICLVVSTLPLWKMMEWKSVGCRIVLGFFVPSGFGIGFGFLSRYHLPCICNSLELEPVILHDICYMLAWSLCILHGICYIWPCLPSILNGMCHILAFQPLICMVFLLHFCPSNVHVGLLRVL